MPAWGLELASISLVRQLWVGWFPLVEKRVIHLRKTPLCLISAKLVTKSLMPDAVHTSPQFVDSFSKVGKRNQLAIILTVDIG